MRRVQAQGCLPVLLALLLVGGLAALALAAGAAAWLATLGILAVLGLARSLWRLVGGGPAASPPGGRGRSGSPVESLPPGWLEREPGGPVVEAGPPSPAVDAGGAGAPGAGEPNRDGERSGPPRG